MADTEEDATAEEKEQSVRNSKELLDEPVATEADDEVKQDIKGPEENEVVTSDVKESDQAEGEVENEPQSQDAAAVEDEVEVREQEERPADDEEEKAEIAEVEHVAADEHVAAEKPIEKEKEEKEYIYEDETKMDIVEDFQRKHHAYADELSQSDTGDTDALLSLDILEATSDSVEVEDKLVAEEDMIALSEEPQFNRKHLLEIYYDAMAKRSKLQTYNFIVQNKLFDYFRKKKFDESIDSDKNVGEHEQRYLKFMAQIEDLRKLESAKRDNYHAIIEEMKEKCMEKKSKADSERKKFIAFKQNVAVHSINSQTGKPVPAKDIEQYVDNELKKEREVVQMRLENIKLKNSMKKSEQRLKLKEQVSEGLHLIDFEQLKIENQTYNEKIEERNEELLKFRKKITSTVQVLTHLKEKLQYVQAENLEKSNDLKEVDATLAQSRDILSRTKQARDSLKIDNHKLGQKCGFLGNESLLRDFEEQKDEFTELESRLDQLQIKHAELTLNCNHIRQKVQQTRLSLA